MIGRMNCVGIFSFCASTNSASQNPPVQLLLVVPASGTGLAGGFAPPLNRPILAVGSA